MGGIAVLVVIWIIGAVLDKKRKEGRRRRAARSSAPAPLEVESVSSSEGVDASQLEGSMLERMLRQLDPQFADQALGKKRSLPNVELERQSPPATATPATMVRGERPQADDRRSSTEALIARRLRAAEARTTGRSDSDHVVFHDSIRKEKKVEPTKESFPVSNMRRAIVWREILGPPKAETIDEW